MLFFDQKKLLFSLGLVWWRWVTVNENDSLSSSWSMGPVFDIVPFWLFMIIFSYLLSYIWWVYEILWVWNCYNAQKCVSCLVSGKFWIEMEVEDQYWAWMKGEKGGGGCGQMCLLHPAVGWWGRREFGFYYNTSSIIDLWIHTQICTIGYQGASSTLLIKVHRSLALS